MKLSFLIAALGLSSVAAFAQSALDTPFQVRYAANLNIADSYVNISNSGASTTGSSFSGLSNGTLCVNVYAFAPDEQLVDCCTCSVSPNSVYSLSVNNDLNSNTLTGVRENSLVIKLLATTGGTCNAATPGTPAAGLLAWGTTVHRLSGTTTYQTTETAFTPSTLSAGELARISQLCSFTQILGSGFGVCGSCRNIALGSQSSQ